MQESPPPHPEAKSRPPYLFLIPAALGIVGFIGYQTVRMGTTDTHVISRSPFAVDTSVAQAVVSGGVITVHAGAAAHPHSQPHPLRLAAAKPSDAPSPAPADSPTPQASASAAQASPNPKPSHSPRPPKHARHVTSTLRPAPASDDDETVAQQPVPQLRPVSARTIANVNVTRDQPEPGDAATTPPITDAPSVRKEAATAKLVQVADAPKPPDAGSAPVNAVDRIVEARMLYAAAPDYPEIARDQGVRGTSVVFVTVDPSGSIVHISIASSSGNPVLDRSAVSAARNSRYAPPKVDGKPAIETYRVTYDFAP